MMKFCTRMLHKKIHNLLSYNLYKCFMNLLYQYPTKCISLAFWCCQIIQIPTIIILFLITVRMISVMDDMIHPWKSSIPTTTIYAFPQTHIEEDSSLKRTRTKLPPSWWAQRRKGSWWWCKEKDGHLDSHVWTVSITCFTAVRSPSVASDTYGGNKANPPTPPPPPPPRARGWQTPDPLLALEQHFPCSLGALLTHGTRKQVCM